ncbi:MAG: hypothetical protein A3F46_01170 [Legionellales bacterium RIFCSPHIGHO2_12_FULL_42_9]|nr:MAG: hypothetical protein A3F46_01170 [Legionellales bacterium RIFCSPHIGHO2_12_FULL_42_9]
MKKISIKNILRITNLIPVIIVACIFATSYNFQFNRNLNQQLITLGESYIRQLLPASQWIIMHHDLSTLQELVDTTATVNSDIKSLMFYNTAGKLIAYHGDKYILDKPFKPNARALTGDYVASRPLNSSSEPYSINFVAAINAPQHSPYAFPQSNPAITAVYSRTDNILGWLSIDLDTKSLLIKREHMYFITLLTTLFGLLINSIIHFFLSRRIYQPINRLKHSMCHILNNEFSTPIIKSSPKEIEVIEQGIKYLQHQYLTTINEINEQIEIATHDLQKNLELVEEKNIQLFMEKKKTEDKRRLESAFIANTSHEIRTPMNGIIGFTNILLETKLDPLQLDYLRTIKTSAQDLLIILNDILDFSKMDAGKLHLDCIPFELRTCIDEIASLATPIAHKKGLDLIVSTRMNVPKIVLGDPIRIKQILNNLINNAIKFTDYGYIVVDTSLSEDGIDDYTMCIAVSDTGIGLSSKAKSKLFHAFQQADPSITRKFGGTGLGLVICKKLVESMQGEIGLISKAGEGSTFSAKIKLKKIKNHSMEQQTPYNDLIAICFDESKLHLEALCNTLKYLGIECVATNSWQTFSQKLRKTLTYDLGFIGFKSHINSQFIELLNKKNIPGILVYKKPLNDLHNLGYQDYLLKPVHTQKTMDVVNSLITNFNKSHTLNDELQNLRLQIQLYKPNVLIAEDNLVNIQLFKSLLTPYAKLTLVEDGKQAVDSCHNQPYQIILLDLQMPNLNGFESALKIRQNSWNNRLTPIILITADCTKIKQENLHIQDINYYLQKPFDEKQLLKLMLDILNINQTKIPIIDWNLCLQKVSGNQTIAQEFLTRFIDELRLNRCELLQFANSNVLDNKMANQLADIAHKLHGACCFTGIPSLQSQVIALEKEAKAHKDYQTIKLKLVELIEKIDDIVIEFEKFYV